MRADRVDSMPSRANAPPIEELEVSAFRIPTDAPEADGTLHWEATMLIVVRARAGSEVGLGYSYTARAAAALVYDSLQACVVGQPAFDIPGCWSQ